MHTMNLNLYGKATPTVTDETGKVYSIDEAKAAFNDTSNEIGDCNLAMVRLINEDFDLAAVLDFYANN